MPIITGRIKHKPIPKHTIKDSPHPNYKFAHDSPRGKYSFVGDGNIEFQCETPKGVIRIHDDRDHSGIEFYKAYNKIAIDADNYREVDDDGMTTHGKRTLIPGIDSNVISRRIELPSTVRYQYYENGDICIAPKGGFGMVAMFTLPVTINENGEAGKVEQFMRKDGNKLCHDVKINKTWFDKQTKVIVLD